MLVPSSDGLLRCRKSLSVIPPTLARLLNSIVDVISHTLQSRLHSIYLAGSLARGEYQPGHSDVDIFIFVTSGCVDALQSQVFMQMYKHFSDLKIPIVDIRLFKTEWLYSESAKYKFNAFFPLVYKCLAGPDLGLLYPTYTWNEAKAYHSLFDDLLLSVEAGNIQVSECWSIRCCIRACFEVIMERVGFLTRNRHSCVSALIAEFPDDTAFYHSLLALSAKSRIYLTPAGIAMINQTKDKLVQYIRVEA